MQNFAANVNMATKGETHLFSVGQAGFVIKSASGQLLGIDLYLSECVERLEGHMGFKRLLPQILKPDELDFDVLIATHPHLDHFDADSIKELMRNGYTRLLASVDCAREVEKIDLVTDNIKYVAPGDSERVGDFNICFVNCDHGTGAPDAIGVIVSVDGKRILEVGDTCLRLDRTEEYTQNGSIDVMIAPINGAYGNMNEQECAMLSNAVKPKLTIPCHYGMFASHGGDPGKFYETMKNEYPSCAFILMRQGEGISL